jgi:mannose-6-phosphate isomerase-like protein (cupin superfamily)
MWIVEGSMVMTVGDEMRELGEGDVVVVNRGIEHELVSEGGVTFVEAMAPVPRDHIPDPERDLVVGELGDSLHVDR